jgi:ATP-dependent RNA helicase DDX23/PRP28
LVSTPAPALAKKKTPLDIDEILKKKREADSAAAKPRFIPKAERERLAKERAAKEAEAAAATAATAKAASTATTSRKPPLSNGYASSARSSAAAVVASGSRSSKLPPSGPRGGSAAVGKLGHVPTGPAAMRNFAAAAPSSMTTSTSKAAAMATNGAKETGERGAAGGKTGKRNVEDYEAGIIRQRYMGPDMSQSNFSAKKKRKRTTEKKFNFEWDAEEDTSMDHSPLYQGQVEWRGKLGGFDDSTREQSLLKYAKQLEERDPEHGAERARELLEMEKRRKDGSRRYALELHWSQKKLEDMRERDWRIFKEDFNISTKGGSIPNPMRSWAESALPQGLLDIVAQVGYTDPSPIQRAAIPIALQSRDLIGVAVTGSGKTAAFLLPLLVYISELPPLNDFTKNDGPYAIVLAPTRELAQQIETEAKKFATPLGFKVVSIVGGHSIEEQAYQLRDGAEIIIATPGRLVDCIERRLIVLGQCCYIIMDEADRMIDLGFEEPVNKILSALPVSNEKPDTDEAESAAAMSQILPGANKDLRYRQTMMYTATMPGAVERIARAYLRRPAIVTIGQAGEAVETVEQVVEFISGEDKRKKRLVELLHQYPAPIIVFVNIKRNADAVARDVKAAGHSAVTLHGSKTQEQREAALAALRGGQADVLVATDLAGRGIDVPDVSLVVNFNMAMTIEGYTHRIGRTGRAGKSGKSITFLGSEDSDVLYVSLALFRCKNLLTYTQVRSQADVDEVRHLQSARGAKEARGGAAETQSWRIKENRRRRLWWKGTRWRWRRWWRRRIFMIVKKREFNSLRNATKALDPELSIYLLSRKNRISTRKPRQRSPIQSCARRRYIVQALIPTSLLIPRRQLMQQVHSPSPLEPTVSFNTITHT